MNLRTLSNLTVVTFIIGLLVISNALVGQDSKYYPKGDPKVLNIEFNPFLWMPAISGNIGSDKVNEDFNASSVDIISNLEFAFMFNADISKGKFFASPSYVYTKLGSDKTVVSDKNGEAVAEAYPELLMNIFELLVGLRYDLNEKIYLDPYIGFRYTNYDVSGRVEGIADTTEFDEKKDYFDPVLGLRVHYYPHPRVPITLKTDIGGFGAGSQFSWTAALNAGYSLSPTVDLVAGITAYGSNFEEENNLGNDVGMNLTMYGFDLGVRIMIPARSKDAAIFKKFKE